MIIFLKIHFESNLNLITSKGIITLFILLVKLVAFFFITATANANISKYIEFKKFELLEDCGTITDIDGNVYETVMVAGTCWIKSNLKVKHYRNGDPIPEVQDREEWAALKTGAWCYFDNDPANEEKYGLLYNFYAVEDPRGLGPEGWEVPSYCEFNNIGAYYGADVAAEKIMDPEEWPYHPNYNPDNESGLSVLPAGWRTGSNPDFNGTNWSFSFWTRTIGPYVDYPYAASSGVGSRGFGIFGEHPKSIGRSIRVTKINEPQFPSELIPEEIFQCIPGWVGSVLSDHPQIVGNRPQCLNYPFWLDDFFCYRWESRKVFKEDVSSEPLKDYDKFEYDVTYYVLLGNGIPKNVNQTNSEVMLCNLEYKAIIFRRSVLPAPEGDGEQFFCDLGRISDFEVVGENLVWFDAMEGGNILSVNSILEHGKTYYASQKSEDCESELRLPVRANILQPAVPIGESVQEFCYSATVADLLAEGADVVWYNTAGNVLGPTNILANNGIYRAVSKVGECESDPFQIKAVLKSTPSPEAAPVQEFCNGARLSEIEIDGTTVEIYETDDSSVPLDKESLVVFDRDYFATQTIDGCESRDKVKIRVELKEIPLPSAVDSQAFCTEAFVGDLAITGENIKWYKDQSMTEQVDSEFRLENGTVYFATQTMGGCESLPLGVAVSITSIAKPEGDANQDFCQLAKVSDLSAIGTGIRWYGTEDDIHPLSGEVVLVDGAIYYTSQTVGECESPQRLSVSVNIQQPDVPTGESVQEFCHTALIADLEVEGIDVVWYNSEGDPLIATDILANDGIYRAVSREGGCESGQFEVKAVLKSTPAPQGASVQEFCFGASLSEIEIVGTSVVIYETVDSSVPLDKESLVVFGRDYFATQTIDDCESVERVRIRIEQKEIPPPSAVVSQTFCNKAFVGDLAITGENIKWYKDQSMIEQVDSEFKLEDGLIYFATQTVEGCESLPLGVAVSISSIEKPEGEEVQDFCQLAKVSDLLATGTGIRWYSKEDDNQPLSLNADLIDGSVYYASQTIDGCESPERLSVKVNINLPQTPKGDVLQKVCDGSILDDLVIEGEELAWYRDTQGLDVLQVNSILENGKIYYVSQKIGGCESERLAIKIEIVPSSSPIADEKQNFCESAEPKVKNLFAVGESVAWYKTETGGNRLAEEELLEKGTVYYASDFNQIGCESKGRTAVEVIIFVCEIEVFNLVTLDGNDKNAYLKIKDLEHFPENRLEIFNRYGIMVYAMDGYGQNGHLFYGESNISGVPNAANGLPSGNYLYILTYKMPVYGRTERVSGYLHLINVKN